MSSSRKRPHEGSKQKDGWTQKPRHGLYNQGATCYLNSVLQVLSATPEMHDRLDPKSKRKADRELRKIFEKLRETTCGTENITETLELEQVNQQGDAAEILELILQKINPQASQVFKGQLTYTIKCSKDHVINEETNPFWTLPLPLKDTGNAPFNVERGLRRIFETKIFRGDNEVFCNDCNKTREATSGCEMGEFPQNLILLLKRFDFDFNTMSHMKSDCYVEVPRVLDTKKRTYKLYGMVNHMGSLRDGHYTATILSSEDKSWYEFDDVHVQKLEEQPFTKSRTYNSNTAYLLLYRASGSPRGEDETYRPGEQRRHKVEPKRTRESVTDKENRHFQESLAQKRKERHKEPQSYQYRGEASEPERQRHQHPDGWTKPDSRVHMSHKEEDENSSQSCKGSKLLKKPLVIGAIVLGVAFIVILPIILTTVS